MADLTFQESAMFARYYGDMNLIDNEMFWADCLMNYKEKVVPLPMVDSPEARRKLADLLECNPGECGACCRYQKVPVSNEDIKRLENTDLHVTVENGQAFMLCKDGCQYLKDGACSVYRKRPDVCMQFPIQNPRDGLIDGKKPFKQLQYRLKCLPAVNVIRAVMRESLAAGQMTLLPDLSLIPKFIDPLEGGQT